MTHGKWEMLTKFWSRNLRKYIIVPGMPSHRLANKVVFREIFVGVRRSEWMRILNHELSSLARTLGS
jgi:hypothetical protein